MIQAVLAWAAMHVAAGDDVESLIQHSVQVPDTLHQEPLGSVALDAVLDEEVMTRTIERDLPLISRQAGLKATADATVREAKQALEGHEKQLKSVWKEFVRRANASGCERPHEVLKQAKEVLLHTGAFVDMQRVAGTLTKLKASEPEVIDPYKSFVYDSLMVGFDAALAPWTAFASGAGLPSVKGQGKLFVNFKLEYAIAESKLAILPDSMRICLSTTRDSSQGKVPALDGVKLFGGVAKWDLVEGKSFGIGAVTDYEAAPDFGWKWTYASDPKPACLFFDLSVLDADEVAASALQAGSRIGAEEELVSGEFPIPRRSKFTEQTWCTPMFDYGGAQASGEPL